MNDSKSQKSTKFDIRAEISGFDALRVESTVESELAIKKRLVCCLASVVEDSDDWFFSFKRCGEDIGAVFWCVNCGVDHRMVHKCSQKWCPVCNWRITEKRKIKLQAWSKVVRPLIHLVLTQKNVSDVSSELIKKVQKNIQKIRRKHVFKKVLGGCYSIETTNVGKGWHVHSHWLLHMKKLTERDLKAFNKKMARAWGKLVGQDYAIIKAIDCGEKDYSKEVCKYVCKGSEMLHWTPNQILEFIHAIRGRRFFSSFGTLYDLKSEVRKIINSSEQPRLNLCSECGENSLEFIPDKSMSFEQRMKLISR